MKSKATVKIGFSNRSGDRRRSAVAWGLKASLAVTAIAALGAGLHGCGSGSGSSSNTVAVQGDVPLAYVKRPNSIGMNPTNGAPSAPGGDLMIREKSSASAREHNVTAAFTQGQGDASDPEASYDGKKIVFAMRCPTSNTATIDNVPACTGRWNIWEYDMTAGGLANGKFRRLTSSTTDDDVDPAYLPANRGFVFSSNRQTKTKTTNAQGQTFYALDEYERERVLNLHTMDADGGNIEQISVNQSHDRNPVVRPNGDIMFSRWEHVGDRNRFAIFRSKPDGTDMFVLYGAHSPGNSFLHPRDMDPNGPNKGYLTSSLMSLSGTDEGGALMLIDAARYSEQNTPANKTVAPQGGQVQITSEPLDMGRGLSLKGRITTPYPLWDGTNRVLIAFRPCEVTKNGVVVACATLTSEETARLNSRNRMMADAANDPVQDNVPPPYAIYMYDPALQTFLIVAAPVDGFMHTDPIALQARAEPATIDSVVGDPALALQNKALIEVRSVYDTDGLGRMGESVLAAVDMPASCTAGIAQTAPIDAMDTRSSVPDLARIKDPADPAYNCAPARFVRATRAVAPQANTMGVRGAIGETEFEPQQILGYAPVEPDGSFKLEVPADTPLALSITDAKGRGLQTHLNWIQVRPGEKRTCDGCHSPRRGAALNTGAVVNSVPDSWLPAMKNARQSGQTMASLRTAENPAMLSLQPDMNFTDVWADTSKANVTARQSIAIAYTGNANPADNLVTAVPVNGLINYPQHVAPLWTRDRGANTCTRCHSDSARLSLRDTIAGTGRMVSYEELLMGDPVIGANGQPQTRIENGVPVIVRGAPLVETSAGGAGGLARMSRLAEIMFGEDLKAGAEARTAHPTPTTPNHATMLNLAEKRVMTEWMDLGGQYYNDLSNGASGVRRVQMLSEASFSSQVLPVLRASCVGCHQPTGSSGAAQTGVSYMRNRFVLTGDVEGDFNVTLGMVTDTCNAASNPLLSRPSTMPHPAGALTQTAQVLPIGSAGYSAIANWIAGGCPTP